MPVAVNRIIGSKEEIPAACIVNKPIVVIVDAIAGNLVHVDPYIGRQVGMVIVDAGVYHGHDNAITQRSVPRSGCADGDQAPKVRVRLSPTSTCAEKWIVG